MHKDECILITLSCCMVNQIYYKKKKISKIIINNSEANEIKQSSQFILFIYLHPNALVSFSLI